MNRLPFPWLTRRSLATRSGQIVSTLTRHGLGWLVSHLDARPTAVLNRPAEDLPRQKQAEHLRLALNELGATFIKLGQALSTRPDLLPPEYIIELCKLQDEVPPAPYEQIKLVLQQELGSDLEAIFAEFDPTPIASASIGQVYAATLHNGHQVVVKVRRPGVAKTIDQDLEIIGGMAEWASKHSPFGQLYDLSTLFSEFSFRLRNELDYLREGSNANIFRQNFAGDTSVYIPYIYWDFTTTQVITIERVRGLKINDLEGMKAAGINLKVVAENSGRFTLRQLFEFGFFHADPHPGNFFVQPDGSLAVMDFGMVGRLTPPMRESLLRIIMALAQSDSDTLADELMDMGITRKPVRRRSLAMELEHLTERYVAGRAQFLSASAVLNNILDLAFRFGLQMPGEFAMLARLSTINEGISMTLYPEFRMLDFAAPYVLNYWKEQRSPQKVLPRLAQSAVDGLELGLDLPRQATRLLKRMERGQLEFGINFDALRDFTKEMQKMTNRLAMSIILGATIVALGIVMLVYHPAAWQSFGDLLFGFAFIFSIAFGAWLMWSIWWSSRGK